ncbi:MAG: 30S ribosomal protein S2 [Candidatus Gracilibacteria bacterium]
MEKEVLKSMFDNLLHIGNKMNFWNPKMKRYIYGNSNGVHIFNLVKTTEKIEEVKERLSELTKSGKKVLFVATKIQGKDIYQKLATETGSYYVSEKWIPGLLTNFKTIKARISTYLRILKEQEMGEFETFTKKEKAAKLLELDKLDRAYGGLKEMKRLPDVIFVVDGIYESQAVKEANTLGIECIAILNSNGDDLVVSNCIPANTNSPKSLAYIADTIKSSIFTVAVGSISKGNVVKKIEDNKSSFGTKTFTKVEEEVKTEVKEEVKPKKIKEVETKEVETKEEVKTA